jgi:hypothetical protein
MDTIIDELEREAAVPADLLQQDPHGEVVESKPSVVSPDEERLAVGASMIKTADQETLGSTEEKAY